MSASVNVPPPATRWPATGDPARLPRIWWVLLGALLAAGVGLRFVQYAAAASQAVDELALSRNVIELSWAQLAHGALAWGQAAPRGFLLLARAAVAIAGPTDLALRSVAMAASLLALVLALRLCLLALPAAGAALAFAVLAVRPELIAHAAEVKPYSCDLAASLAMTLLVWKAVERGLDGRRGLLLGLAGVVAVTFSLAAVIVLAGLAPALVLAAPGPASGLAPAGGGQPAAPAPRRPASALALGAAILPWAMACGIAYALARATTPPPVRAYLREYWSAAFAPPPVSSAQAAWLGNSLGRELPAASLGHLWQAVAGALAICGAVWLWQRHGRRSLLLWGPLAACLAAAELHLYPFAPRLVLFVVPSLAMAGAAGCAALAAAPRPWRPRRPRRPRRATMTAAALTALFGVAVVTELVHKPPVYRPEEIKAVLAKVATHRRSGDAIYIYYGAGAGARFYGPGLGLAAADYRLGQCQRANPRGYLRELDAFRGRRRLWVVFSHALPWLGEQPMMLAYLDALGRQQLAVYTGPRSAGLAAAAFLYDLGGADRAGTASAASFPVPPPQPAAASRFACFGPHNSAAPWPP